MTHSGQAAAEDVADRILGDLVRDYHPVPGIADELIGPDGLIRPVWRNLVGHIAEMSAKELAGRKARADIYLRDSGVFYRQYDQDDTGERDWPLSHMPVLLAQDEWAAITAGLCERADLLERIVADIYGDNTLVRDGHLPAALVAKNPEWLRPLVGVKPRSGHFLHFIAFDIGRGPQGKWWVLGDRTQAPSGIGFSLESRMATKRAFSEMYHQSNVHRLAGFFEVFRDAMDALKTRPDSLVGILTPGQFNDSYFEHAYIARYLGFMLLEGEDLAVRDGQLMVRTIAGLHPIDVLWRRLDAAWADPLELEESSYLGTAGLVGAIRDGGVTMVNALGSGILETRALQAFIPKIAETLTGRPLSLSNIATWWCGQEAERTLVKANADGMIIGNAYSTRLPFDLDQETEGSDERASASYPSLRAWIDAEAENLVGQEAVTLSTTPAFDQDRLVPRPMSLRVFLARTPHGWEVMPGGFSRIGRSSDFTKLALQQGGSVADVWIVSPEPVVEHSLLGPNSGAFDAQHAVALASKAADNLFWLGRYIERAENYFRFLRAYHYRLAESAFKPTPLLTRMVALMETLDMDSEEPLPAAVWQAVMAAKSSAGHVRDRFSTDGWLALTDLAKTVELFKKSLSPGDDTAQAMSVLLRKVSGFAGLVHENMYRFTGWRFLSIGWALERAQFITQLLSEFAGDESGDTELELALEVGDSTMSHRRRFGAKITRSSVTELLALDPLNPRSILQQLNDINAHLGYLPGSGEHHLSALQKSALAKQTALTIHSPETMTRDACLQLHADLAVLSSELSEAYLK